MRILKCGGVTDTGWIEDGDVGLHARTEQPSIAEAEALSGERRHLSNGIFERNRIRFAHIHREHAREGAIVARVGIGFPEHRNTSVGRNHRCRMTENSPKIFFSDCVENRRAVPLFDDPHRCFGCIGNRRLHTPDARDLGQVFSGKRLVPVAARKDHVLWIAASPFILNTADDFRFDVGSNARIREASQDFFPSALLSPCRKERRTDAGARCRIRILIDRCIDAALARLVDKPQRIDAFAPICHSDDLVMR